MDKREKIAEILEHLRKMDEIDRTSYQAGINYENNLVRAIDQILALLAPPSVMDEEEVRKLLEPAFDPSLEGTLNKDGTWERVTNRLNHKYKRKVNNG